MRSEHPPILSSQNTTHIPAWYALFGSSPEIFVREGHFGPLSDNMNISGMFSPEGAIFGDSPHTDVLQAVSKYQTKPTSQLRDLGLSYPMKYRTLAKFGQQKVTDSNSKYLDPIMDISNSFSHGHTTGPDA